MSQQNGLQFFMAIVEPSPNFVYYLLLLIGVLPIAPHQLVGYQVVRDFSDVVNKGYTY